MSKLCQVMAESSGGARTDTGKIFFDPVKVILSQFPGCLSYLLVYPIVLELC